MTKYAVATLSFFDNINKIVVVTSESPSNAIIDAIIATQCSDNDGDTIEHYKTLVNTSVEELHDIFFNMEISISNPIEI